MESSEQPIFIVGVHRSGTTLLRYMLNSHPRIYIPPESDFIPRFFLKKPHGSLSERQVDRILDLIFKKYRFVKEWQGPPLKAKHLPDKINTPAAFLNFLYSTYADQNGAARWGDKTPIYCSYIELISQIFPSAQFIHLIRDGRDVSLSMLDKWALSKWHIDVFYTARNWVRRITEARHSGSRLGPSRYIEIYYEQLVTNTEEVCGLICEYLGEVYCDQMTQPQILAQKFIPEGSFHDPIRYAPTSNRIARWRTEMKASDLRIQQKIAGPLLTSFDYPILNTGKMQLSEKLRYIAYYFKYETLQRLRNIATMVKIKPPI